MMEAFITDSPKQNTFPFILHFHAAHTKKTMFVFHRHTEREEAGTARNSTQEMHNNAPIESATTLKLRRVAKTFT